MNHPIRPTAVSPSMPCFKSRRPDAFGSTLVMARYASTSGEVVGLGRRDFTSAGTQREMGVKVSDAQTGHRWRS
jgi:hypothetical protein